MSRKGASEIGMHQQKGWRLQDHVVAKRKCLGLGCGKEFMSRGPGNRICPRCANRSHLQKRGRFEEGATGLDPGGMR